MNEVTKVTLWILFSEFGCCVFGIGQDSEVQRPEGTKGLVEATEDLAARVEKLETLIFENLSNVSPTTSEDLGGVLLKGSKVEVWKILPPGTVLAYAGDGDAIPDGFLLCDGRALNGSKREYQRLFRAIGTSWGNGSNDNLRETSFNIPELRGRFLRGVDRSARLDPDRDSRKSSNPGGNQRNKVGSVQAAAFQGHYHEITRDASQFVGGNNKGIGGEGSEFFGVNAQKPVSDGVNGEPRIKAETRPKNS